jgi:hypothetical protein
LQESVADTDGDRRTGMAKRAKQGVAISMVSGASSAHEDAAKIDSLVSRVRAAEDAMTAAIARMGAFLCEGKAVEAAQAEREADAFFVTYDALSAELTSLGEAFLKAA